MSFVIEGPAVVSFSGGRTSALMLRRILDAGLQPDVHVLFANTGKEREETLDFVREVSTRWSVPVHWLEYIPSDYGSSFQEVSYETASRSGEPFDALIRRRQRLPNMVHRICTQELKVRVMRDWMRSHGYDRWTMVVGLRADEPRRVARMKALDDQGRERWDTTWPLYTAGVTVHDVEAFWKQQPFDLQLRSWEGNCDACYKKSESKLLRIFQDDPERARWWIEKEAQVGHKFRKDRADYTTLLYRSRLPVLPGILSEDPDDLGCHCTD